jgi:hypothetical protein
VEGGQVARSTSFCQIIDEDQKQFNPAQDYGRLFDHTKATGVGVIGIRVLAGRRQNRSARL